MQHGKNKELESRVNEAEKRYCDEKVLREEGEITIDVLRKKIQMMEKEKELSRLNNISRVIDAEDDHHKDMVQPF